MESNLCETVWSTYKVTRTGEHFDGRRHGCRFPKGHIGRICMCVCGLPHRNVNAKDDAPATV